jgi:type IV fimbrial biogenesis protein FimT
MPGFTLVELLVTIAIAAIVVTLAVPGMATMARNAQLSGNANQLVTALNLARSEAVKRGQRVVVRKTGTNWEDGWQVFVDITSPNSNTFSDDADATLCEAAEDCVLRVYGALPAGYTLRGHANFADFIRYDPSGRSSSDGSFALCNNPVGDNAPQANTARLILVNAVGRVRVGGDSDNNGVPEKDNGVDMASCTVSPF